MSEANCKLEANPELETSHEPKTSLNLDKKREASPQFNTNIELEGENWAPSLISVSKYKVDGSLDEIQEDKDFTQDYLCLLYKRTVIKNISVLSWQLKLIWVFKF